MSYVESLFSLHDRIIVVTGGAGGIPGALALGFAKAGAKVSLWGRGTGHPIPEAVEALKAASGREEGIHGVTVDLGDKASVEAAIARTELELGRPDALVNGVGGNKGKSAFIDADESVFREVVELNLMAGLVTPTRAFARYWIEKGIAGDVLNMASMGSYRGLSGIWAYNAAKAAVLNLNSALAKELAPKGIRVNAIAPGFFVGYQNKALLIDEATGGLTARGKTIIERTPAGRFGEKEELVGAAIYLISRKASGFVNGVCVPVDGGFLTDCI
jgi:NAD(P)-dependent dehydrogenase (short-subunit alcohol dehydrogenase family)